MSIGENLSRIRQMRKLTQRELAQVVGVNQSMIAQVERGTKSLSLELAKQVSEVLKCDVNDFYSDNAI